MSGDVVEFLESNLWSMWSHFGNGPGCSLVDEPGLLRYETPIARVPYNMVLRFRADGDVDAGVAAALDPSRERSVPVMWLVHPTAEPADLGRPLARHGLEHAEVLTGMAAPISALPPTEPDADGVELVRVEPGQQDAFIGLVAWRYELDAADAPILRAIFETNGFGRHDSPNQSWVAVRGGEVVSKVSLHLTDETAAIYGLATRPQARGLGLARQLTCTAFAHAAERGATTALLHSTTMAVSLYRTLGFEPVADFQLWAPAP